MRVLYLIFNLVLIFKLINAYAYTSIQYEKTNCGGQIVTIQSSTYCSPLGRFKYAGEGKVSVTYANEIKSIQDCEDVAIVNTNQTLNQCQKEQTQFKMFLNQDDPVALAEGFCGTITTFDNNCEYLQLTSYVNGACEGLSSGNSWYRYVCDGTTVQRYTCTKDCSDADNLSSCTFESNLPSIDTCNVQVKPLDDIIGDSLGSSSTNNSIQLNISISILIISLILSIMF